MRLGRGQYLDHNPGYSSIFICSWVASVTCALPANPEVDNRSPRFDNIPSSIVSIVSPSISQNPAGRLSKFRLYH